MLKQFLCNVLARKVEADAGLEETFQMALAGNQAINSFSMEFKKKAYFTEVEKFRVIKFTVLLFLTLTKTADNQIDSHDF
jgi:hypothetical protein